MKTVTDHGTHMFSRLRLSQLFGLASLILLGAAAFAPDALHVPLEWRGWILVLFIVWLLLVTSGIFNP